MQETISLVLPPSVSMKEILKYTLLVEVALCCPLKLILATTLCKSTKCPQPNLLLLIVSEKETVRTCTVNRSLTHHYPNTAGEWLVHWSMIIRLYVQMCLFMYLNICATPASTYLISLCFCQVHTCHRYGQTFWDTQQVQGNLVVWI